MNAGHVAVEAGVGVLPNGFKFAGAGDFNHDGVVNPADVAIVASHDLNLNGKEDLSDLQRAIQLGGWKVLTTKVTSASAIQTRVESDPFADFDLDHDGWLEIV